MASARDWIRWMPGSVTGSHATCAPRSHKWKFHWYCSRFLKWERLLRSTAYVFLFFRQCRGTRSTVEASSRSESGAFIVENRAKECVFKRVVSDQRTVKVQSGEKAFSVHRWRWSAAQLEHRHLLRTMRNLVSYCPKTLSNRPYHRTIVCSGITIAKPWLTSSVRLLENVNGAAFIEQNRRSSGWLHCQRNVLCSDGRFWIDVAELDFFVPINRC